MSRIVGSRVCWNCRELVHITEEPHSCVRGDSLREKVESLLLVHRQASWDKNLGQYRSEHKCECGYTFVSNGHTEDSSVRVLMAEHVSVQVTDLLESELGKANDSLRDLKKVNGWLFQEYVTQHGYEKARAELDAVEAHLAQKRGES